MRGKICDALCRKYSDENSSDYHGDGEIERRSHSGIFPIVICPKKEVIR